MARKRKTKAERHAEFSAAQSKVWDEFEPKLASVQNLAEAMTLALAGPPHDTPGRAFHTNLMWFLDNFTAPMGANLDELRHYLTILGRLDAGAALKPGVKERAEKSIKERMENAIPA